MEDEPTYTVELDRADLCGLLYAITYYETHGLFGHKDLNSIEEKIRSACDELPTKEYLRDMVAESLASIETVRREQISLEELVAKYRQD